MGDAGSAGAVFWRAIQNGNVTAAESALWEIQASTNKPVPLDYAIALVHLYGRKYDKKYESAALRYLERYISEENPRLLDVAITASLLAERSHQPSAFSA